MNWKALTIVACIAAWPAGAQTVSAWRAGAARVDIAPKESIRQHIYVKALALQDGTRKNFVLVTVDLVDTWREVWDAVAERCEKKYALSRDRMVRRYTDDFMDKAVTAVGQAIGNLSPATLEFNQGFAGIAVNRRRVRLRSLPEPVDQDVPVLAVRDPAGVLRAIVVGYSCHATAFEDYQISGDWPGYAQEEIERAHPGAMALVVRYHVGGRLLQRYLCLHSIRSRAEGRGI
jgi:hypothetical protein